MNRAPRMNWPLAAALFVALLLVSLPASARKAKKKRAHTVPVAMSVVIPFKPASQFAPIHSALSAELRARLEVQPLLPRLENLPLPNGITVMLDRSLQVRWDLATLFKQRVQQPDTYSLTLEAQSGSGWLWLTYHVPGTKEAPPVAATGVPLPR